MSATSKNMLICTVECTTIEDSAYGKVQLQHRTTSRKQTYWHHFKSDKTLRRFILYIQKENLCGVNPIKVRYQPFQRRIYAYPKGKLP